MRRASVGFSLLEILVAFVILALAFGVLMRVFSGALANTVLSERYATATLIAESRLAAVGVETWLEEAETSGETESGYRWNTRVTREPDEGIAADIAPTIGLFRVEVEVSWSAEADKTRKIKLVTLRTGALQ